MHALAVWLSAGSPPHWTVVVGGAYALLEYALPRTNSVKARSVLEGLANLIGLLVPLAKKLGTPDPEKLQ